MDSRGVRQANENVGLAPQVAAALVANGGQILGPHGATAEGTGAMGGITSKLPPMCKTHSPLNGGDNDTELPPLTVEASE